jgi:hypothetical protein
VNQLKDDVCNDGRSTEAPGSSAGKLMGAPLSQCRVSRSSSRSRRANVGHWRYEIDPPRITSARRAPAPQAFCNLVFFMGSERTGEPVAAWIALSTAGAATLIVGSPTPPQKPPDGMTMVSTFGKSSISTIG